MTWEWHANSVNADSKDFKTASLTITGIKKNNSVEENEKGPQAINEAVWPYMVYTKENILYGNGEFNSLSVFRVPYSNYSLSEEIREADFDVFYFFVHFLNQGIEIPFKFKWVSEANHAYFGLSTGDSSSSDVPWVKNIIQLEKFRWDSLGYTKPEDLIQENKQYVDQGIRKEHRNKSVNLSDYTPLTKKSTKRKKSDKGSDKGEEHTVIYFHEKFLDKNGEENNYENVSDKADDELKEWLLERPKAWFLTKYLAGGWRDNYYAKKEGIIDPNSSLFKYLNTLQEAEFYKSLLSLKLEDYQRLTKKSNSEEGKNNSGIEYRKVYFNEVFTSGKYNEEVNYLSFRKDGPFNYLWTTSEGTVLWLKKADLLKKGKSTFIDARQSFPLPVEVRQALENQWAKRQLEIQNQTLTNEKSNLTTRLARLRNTKTIIEQEKNNLKQAQEKLEKELVKRSNINYKQVALLGGLLTTGVVATHYNPSLFSSNFSQVDISDNFPIPEISPSTCPNWNYLTHLEEVRQDNQKQIQFLEEKINKKNKKISKKDSQLEMTLHKYSQVRNNYREKNSQIEEINEEKIGLKKEVYELKVTSLTDQKNINNLKVQLEDKDSEIQRLQVEIERTRKVFEETDSEKNDFFKIIGGAMGGTAGTYFYMSSKKKQEQEKIKNLNEKLRKLEEDTEANERKIGKLEQEKRNLEDQTWQKEQELNKVIAEKEEIKNFLSNYIDLMKEEIKGFKSLDEEDKQLPKVKEQEVKIKEYEAKIEQQIKPFITKVDNWGAKK